MVSDRPLALINATQGAVDPLYEGVPEVISSRWGAPTPQLGPGTFLCSYGFEGGAVSMLVEGSDTDGYYVEATSFIVD